MTDTIIARAADGYYHPASEADVVALVRHAAANGLKLRVRGATHSVAWSIFTDPVDGAPANLTLEAAPPAGANLNLAVDRLDAFTWLDQANGLVEVGAGIHIGYDPNDPFGASTPANSLVAQAFAAGWALDILGGITHQTISGFTGTGSAGGSVRYGFDNVEAFRVVDGLGNAEWIARGDAAFDAMLTACGLMGVVVAVRLKLVPMYDIAGNERTSPVTGPDCKVDLFGPGDTTRPSLQQFFTDTDYSRLTWWPQKGCERVQIWQAARTAPAPPGAKRVPYQEFTPDLTGWVTQLAASVFFVLLGNTGLGRTLPLIAGKVGRFNHCLGRQWATSGLGAAGPLAAAVVTAVLAVVIAIPVLILSIPGLMRALFTTLLPLFYKMTGTGAPTEFNDWYWRSLCMDNTADDDLLGTEFVEIWLPIQYTARVMTLFQEMFTAGGTAATGYFAQEVYAAKPTAAWLNPSYSDGTDDYKDGVVRFDVYWYRNNDGAPNVIHGFYEQYWNLLLANGIPFRFHWGKFIPLYDFPFWADHYRRSLPRFDDFMALRAIRDPHDVFFTDYWRSRLTGVGAGPTGPAASSRVAQRATTI